MASEPITTFFSSYVQPNARYHDRRAAVNKALYFGFTIYSVVAAGLVIPLVALAPQSLIYRICAAAISGSVVVATAISGFTKFQENWLSSRATWDALMREEQWYRHSVYEYRAAADPEGLFVERVTAVLAKEGSEFLALHARKEPPKGAASSTAAQSQP